MPREDLKLEDYKKFFDNTPVALIRTDIKTGEFLMANQYAVNMFGFETEEELKKKVKITDLYPIDERKKLIQKLKKGGNVEDFEIQLVLPNKSIWVSCRLRINCDGTCIEGSMIDISELVELKKNQLGILKEVGNQIDDKIAALSI